MDRGPSDKNSYPLWDVQELNRARHFHWAARAGMPGFPNGKRVLIYQEAGELWAITAACPHEGHDFRDAMMTPSGELECPLHQNCYRIGVDIPAYRVIQDGDGYRLVDAGLFESGQLI